jgi:hypothetical protein
MEPEERVLDGRERVCRPEQPVDVGFCEEVGQALSLGLVSNEDSPAVGTDDRAPRHDVHAHGAPPRLRRSKTEPFEQPETAHDEPGDRQGLRPQLRTHIANPAEPTPGLRPDMCAQ